VIHVDEFPIPHHLARPAMACVEVGIGQKVPVSVPFDIYSESVSGITDQSRAVGSRVVVQDARGHLVMVIGVALIRVPSAAVEHLVGSRVPTLSIEGVVEVDTVIQDSDGASDEAGRGSGKCRRNREHHVHILGGDMVRVLVVLVRRVAMRDGEDASRVINGLVITRDYSFIPGDCHAERGVRPADTALHGNLGLGVPRLGSGVDPWADGLSTLV
jgi:hypothetical protein